MEMDGYVWIAVDVKKNIIVAGDETAETMKRALLDNKSAIQDIFGIGFDLELGEIDFVSPINKKFIDKNSTREVPEEKHDRIETMMYYFFSELPAFKKRGGRPRYSKRP